MIRREPKISAKEIRREVAREVAEVMEDFQKEEGERKDATKGVAGNIHNE